MAGALRHFRSVTDITASEMRSVLDMGLRLKKVPRAKQADILRGRTMGMIFEKPSLRTHVSFETGMAQLGGHAVYLGPQQIGALDGSREPVKDIASVLTRMCDVVTARVFQREVVYEIADNAKCPVINALCNMEHPCQIMADLTTIIEHKGGLDGIKVAFVGDGNNNVTHSLAIACSMLGMDFAVAAPASDQMAPEMSDKCKVLAAGTGATITETTDPYEAVAFADIVYTDTFVSMGDEANKEAILKRFQGFQVDKKLMAAANPEALFMHDMPAYRGIEVAANVIDGPKSIIYDQAENRQHAQKAVVLHLLGVSV